MSRYPLEQRLADAGKARRKAEDERLATARLLRNTVREAARSKDWSKTRIAEVAGISRQTVHEMLKES